MEPEAHGELDAGAATEQRAPAEGPARQPEQGPQGKILFTVLASGITRTSPVRSTGFFLKNL